MVMRFCPSSMPPARARAPPRSLLAPVQPGDRPLCVLNTHLFFHYMAPHIRTMHVWAMVQVGRQQVECAAARGAQGGAFGEASTGRPLLESSASTDVALHFSPWPPACPEPLQEAHELIEATMADPATAAQLGNQRPSLLFCGDLNSGVCVECGVWWGGAPSRPQDVVESWVAGSEQAQRRPAACLGMPAIPRSGSRGWHMARLSRSVPLHIWCLVCWAHADLNDGIPGAIELLSKGSVHADFWDWWYGADFKWEKGADSEEGPSGEGQEEAAGAGNGAAAAAARQQAAAPAAASGTGEFGEVAKQVHSAVEHAHPPGSPAAHSAPGAGNQQQFVAGVDLRIPFR